MRNRNRKGGGGHLLRRQLQFDLVKVFALEGLCLEYEVNFAVWIRGLQPDTSVMIIAKVRR